MKGRFITAKVIAEFKEHLILEERSEITVEKYIRDVKAFAKYAQKNTCRKIMLCGALIQCLQASTVCLHF